ncbi:hypothetical protein GGR50DRAFT_693090 [Xylaria sp. CBS 124048]|nr:hypothetical protein GGR50DRAFT_693090 [Xylaria sp. CBS 124048]
MAWMHPMCIPGTAFVVAAQILGYGKVTMVPQVYNQQARKQRGRREGLVCSNPALWGKMANGIGTGWNVGSVETHWEETGAWLRLDNMNREDPGRPWQCSERGMARRLCAGEMMLPCYDLDEDPIHVRDRLGTPGWAPLRPTLEIQSQSQSQSQSPNARKSG